MILLMKKINSLVTEIQTIESEVAAKYNEDNDKCLTKKGSVTGETGGKVLAKSNLAQPSPPWLGGFCLF